MWSFNNAASKARQNELLSDLYIEQNVVGGLDSPFGQMLDNMMSGNPNPTFGQVYGDMGNFLGFGNEYGYHHHHQGGW